MTSISSKRKAQLPSQAFLAKTFHWVNLISLILMLTSGLKIYNANPVFGGRAGWHFPDFLLLGGWLAGGRDWHFAIMWSYSRSFALVWILRFHYPSLATSSGQY